MKKRALLEALGIFTATLIAFVVIAPSIPKTHTPAPLAAVVKVVDGDGGHGSGTHLGNGVILTAAHVVEGEEKITVIDAAGVQSNASVIWLSQEYDIALLSTNYTGPSAALRCDPAGVGEGVTASGSPGEWDFVTTYGHVARTALVRGMNDIKEVLMLDLNIGQGMSGGPIFDSGHRIIGVVSMMAAPQKLVGSFSFAVPSTTVCRLLARTK